MSCDLNYIFMLKKFINPFSREKVLSWGEVWPLSKINSLSPSRKSGVLIYCATHARSSRALPLLMAKYDRKATFFRGGIVQWQSASRAPGFYTGEK
ncbi:MAG: hypothetical protein OEV92_12295 [Nitrospinota bacterium]|nr:hypothetical protein [Nitrospinota bacterium]